MTTGFDTPIEESLAGLANGLDALGAGQFPLFLRYVNFFNELEVRYEQATFNGLTEWEAKVVATSGTVVSNFVNAQLDIALTKAVIAAAVAQPTTTPVAIYAWIEGIFINVQASSIAGDLAADAMTDFIKSDFFQSNVYGDQSWSGIGQGQSLEIRLYSGNDNVTNEEVTVIVTPNASGFSATVTSDVTVTTASILESLGRSFGETISWIPVDGITIDITNGTETMKGIFGSSFADDVTAPNDVQLVLLDDGNDMVRLTDQSVTIDGGSGNDTISYFGASEGVDVDLGAGNTYLASNVTNGILQGQPKDIFDHIENITGTAFADIILGDEVNNTLRGEGGDDILDGGAGNDSIVGGAGADTIIGSDGIDTISGGSAPDLLDYSSLDRGLYFDLDERRHYELNGSSKGSLKDIANGLQEHILTDHDDVVVSANYDGGNFKDDSIDAGAGDDLIYSSHGDDLYIGGAGDDTVSLNSLHYFGTNDGDPDTTIRDEDGVIKLNAIGGYFNNGWVTTSGDITASNLSTDANYGDYLRVIGDGISFAITEHQSFTTYSNGLQTSNYVAGSGADNDLMIVYGLTGGSGARLQQGFFANQIVSQTAFGYSSIRGVIVLEDIDVSIGDITVDLINDLVSIGNYTAPDPNETIDGTSGADSLDGADGNDTINGLAGNDTIIGGSGNDSLNGGADIDLFAFDGNFGADTITGGEQLVVDGATLSGEATYDSVSGSWSLGGFTVTQAGGLLLSDGSGNSLQLTDWDESTQNYGVTLEDTTPATPGLALGGTAGDDSLYGGAGEDTVWGNGGNDVASTYAGNDSLYGGDGDDLLYGGDDDDLIAGDAGNDTLSGDLGNDSMGGGDGNDTVYGADGDDTVDGGSGADFVTGDAGNDYVLGNLGNDQLYGGTGADSLFGQDGADTLQGGDDNDYVDGGADADGVYGEAGNDVLYGQGGNDWIDGGAGDDAIVGGTGSDGLTGGAGIDTFIYASTADSVLWSGDWVYDFASGTDKFDLSAITTGISMIGTGGFTGAGNEMRHYFVGTNTVNHLDVNGDAIADFEIITVGLNAIQQSDLLYN